jgi:hypothetical protein
MEQHEAWEAQSKHSELGSWDKGKAGETKGGKKELNGECCLVKQQGPPGGGPCVGISGS